MEANGVSRDEWMTLAELCRVLGKKASGAKSVALAGGIRTRSLPGARIQYSREDAVRLGDGRRLAVK